MYQSQTKEVWPVRMSFLIGVACVSPSKEGVAYVSAGPSESGRGLSVSPTEKRHCP